MSRVEYGPRGLQQVLVRHRPLRERLVVPQYSLVLEQQIILPSRSVLSQERQR
jgi:hypothetical protein